MKTLSKNTLLELQNAQEDEITSYYVYTNLAAKIKDPHNAQILKSIAENERVHYNIFKKYTGVDIPPNQRKIRYYTFIARVFGLTFGVKLLENGEKSAQKAYNSLISEIPEMASIIEDEERHELELIDLLDEERLSYMSSVVLGLNDALVELTGALAGFTLSIQNSRTIALMGLITGISASFSMAASEYLSTKTEGGEEASTAGTAALYTGLAYVFTVICLILPYFLISNYIVSLGVTIAVAVLIIFVFNYYISVAKGYNFRKRFLEMAVISIGVSIISFVIGYLVNQYWGLEI